MLDIIWVFAVLVALAILMVMTFLIRPKKRPAPAQPKKLVGPDVDAIKLAVTDVIAEIEVQQMALVDARNRVFLDAQGEIERLSTEIKKSQIALESYHVTIKTLDREQPRIDPPAAPTVTIVPDLAIMD
jgi:hypothetical protein